MAKILQTFIYDGEELKVSFVETTPVTKGVVCDVYAFANDMTKDLGIIHIEQGCKTPLQKVLKGDRTIEGYISGKGKLVITKLDGTQTEYRVDDSTTKPFEISVAIGELIQLLSDRDAPLIMYEICFPPYADGRFENIVDTKK